MIKPNAQFEKTTTTTEHFTIALCTATGNKFGRNYEEGKYYIMVTEEGTLKPGTFTTEEKALRIANRNEQEIKDRIAKLRAEEAEEEKKAAEAKAQAEEEAKTPKVDYATDRQVDFILDLIAQGRRQEAGFFDGPTKPTEVRKLTKAQASAYIKSLLGDF